MSSHIVYIRLGLCPDRVLILVGYVGPACAPVSPPPPPPPVCFRSLGSSFAVGGSDLVLQVWGSMKVSSLRPLSVCTAMDLDFREGRLALFSLQVPK